MRQYSKQITHKKHMYRGIKKDKEVPKKDDKKVNKNQQSTASMPTEANRATNVVTGGLGLDDALKMAYGATGEGAPQNAIKPQTESQVDKLDIVQEDVAKSLAYVPKSELSGKKVVKGSFDNHAPSQNFSVSATQLYAEATKKALQRKAANQTAPTTNQSTAPTASATTQAASKAQKQEQKRLRKALQAQPTRAHGDYDLQGNVNSVIARNESDIRAMEISDRKKKIAAIVILIIFLIFLLTFGISMIITNTTGFTVNMTGNDSAKGLTLYDNAALQNGTSNLVTNDIPDCDNQTYSELVNYVKNTIDKGDGQQSKPMWFFAYSFYLQNVGKAPVDFTFNVTMRAVAKGVDDAVRIMLITDSKYYGAPGNTRNLTVYAKPASDPDTGSWIFDNQNKPLMQKLYAPDGEIYPPDAQDNAVPFYSPTQPISFLVQKLSNRKGANVLKYTIVVYLEGGDADCTNMIRGGGIKLKANMKVEGYELDDGVL